MMYNTIHEKVVGIKCINAFPTSISDITLSHEETTALNFNVTFAYDYWEYEKIDED